MKLKRTCMMFAAVFTLMGAAAVNASALEYDFDGVEAPEYYRATSYEDAYGAEYHYGGTNVVDYEIPQLPYGTSSNTGIGPMEKVHLPGNMPAAGTGTGGYVSAGSGEIYVDGSYDGGYIPPYTPTGWTAASELTRKDDSIGTVSISSLDIKYKVYEGETNASMSKGLGHYTSTSAWDGNVGVCGHNRGAKYVIGAIKDLEIGDTITYTTTLGTRTYTVETVATISSTDWSYLVATSDNRITITTCLANQPAYRICVQAVEIK